MNKTQLTLKMQACGFSSLLSPSRSTTLKVIMIGTLAADCKGIPLSVRIPVTSLLGAVGR